jgi:hypothetical protein
MVKLRNGHAPGHVRETLCDALEAWIDWEDDDGPEPTVEYEIGYEPHRISISRALRLGWNCTDIVPGDLFHHVQSAAKDRDLVIKKRTYAACARAVVADTQSRTK